MNFENVFLLLPGHRIVRGTLTISNGRISAIEESAAKNLPRPTRLVMPGLINAHGHTPMTLVRGVGSGLPLQRWLEEAIFPIEAKMKPKDIAAGMAWGCLEMWASGTTCVADMYDFPDESAAVLTRLGMRANLCRVGLAFSEKDDVPPNRLAECIAFAQRNDPTDLIRYDICVHSEYPTNEKFCRALAEANQTLRRPIHVHVSETEREHNECLARHNQTPIAYLASTGLFDHGGYAAHGVYCTDDDFRIMREHNVSLVHNPTSNMKLGSGFARIPQAHTLGVNIALGTDGCASNDNLDMFEEMHLASLIHKGITRNPTTLSAWDILDMATIQGARALGRTDIGELKVGYHADLCVLNLDAPRALPTTDLANAIVHSLQASDVEETYIGGRQVYCNGVFPTIADKFTTLRDNFLSSHERLLEGVSHG